MKKTLKYILVSSALVLLAACGKEDEASSEPKAPLIPIIPTLTADQLIEMSKNERQELERRCLGVSHPTCTALKGNYFKELKMMKLSTCRFRAAQKGFLKERYVIEREYRICDEKYE